MSEITPREALEWLKAGRVAAIDVRSEGEFAHGAVPGFVNLPILSDAERHQVGITYKTSGQAAAVELGHALVAPTRQARIDAWMAASRAAPEREALVTCWRGGMRSELACAWIGEAGGATRRVQGGYKAMRQLLLAEIEAPPSMVVLAGMTGSWKTALLREFPAAAVVDLEAMAVHRGSTFGAIDGMPQPSQATFENALGASLFGGRRERLIEDESAGIGRVYLPRAFRGAMLAAPAIVLECPADERAANIYEEYVATPLAQGKSPAAHQDRLVANLRGIERRLGSQLTGDLVQRVGAAFAAATRDLHLEWISLLLSSYYDRAYQHAFQAKPRTVLFRGSREECRQWISRRFA